MIKWIVCVHMCNVNYKMNVLNLWQRRMHQRASISYRHTEQRDVFHPESRCFPSESRSEDSPACCPPASYKWSVEHACAPSGRCPRGLWRTRVHTKQSESGVSCERTHSKHSKHTLTLRDGKHQVPLLQQLPVQAWGPKDKVCDCRETCPANSWLDVLLHVGEQKRAFISSTEEQTVVGMRHKLITWCHLMLFILH